MCLTHKLQVLRLTSVRVFVHLRQARATRATAPCWIKTEGAVPHLFLIHSNAKEVLAPHCSLNCATKTALQACTETRPFKDKGVGEKKRGEHWHNYFLSQITAVTLFRMQLYSCTDMAKAHCELYHEGKISRVTSTGFNGKKKACDAIS